MTDNALGLVLSKYTEAVRAMPRYLTQLGAIVLLGGIAGVWLQSRASGDEPAQLTAPGSFEPAEAAPLRAPSGFVAIDHEVRPVASGLPQTSSRRSSLAGRLQSLKQDDAKSEPLTAPPATSSRRVITRPSTISETPESDVDTDIPAETVSALPSVLKRNRERASAVAPTEEVTETVASPSDTKPVVAAPRPAENIRTAPSRSRMGGTPAPAAETPAPTSTTTTIKPSQRPQTLAAGVNAALAVETTGPKAMTLGKPSTYSVSIVNQGVNEASDVFVAVNVPEHAELSNVSGTTGDANATNEAGVQRIVWKLDRIAGRGQEKLTLELVPQSSEPIKLDVEWTMAPPMTTTELEVLEPKLAMSLKGPKEVLYGATAVYQIIVSNPGTGDAEDVVVDLVSADGGASDAKKLGTITAGQQKIIEVSMTASQAGPMNMNFAGRSGTLTAEVHEEVLVRRANLELAMEGPQLVFAGSEATYTIQVTNSGDAPAENVQLGSLLPDGSEYLGGITGAKPKSNQLVWSAGTLAPGATANFEFSLQMTTAGTFDVQLQSKSGDLTASANATTKVEAVADLKLTVNDPQGPKPVGEEVTYEVTIVNRGTKAARKVAVVINFSEGIDPISVEGGTAEIASGQAMFSPIVSIDAGATHKLKVKAKADRAGSHIFRAEVRCTDPETRLASEQTTRFFGSGNNTAAKEPAAGQFTPSTSAKPTTLKRR